MKIRIVTIICSIYIMLFFALKAHYKSLFNLHQCAVHLDAQQMPNAQHSLLERRYNQLLWG